MRKFSIGESPGQALIEELAESLSLRFLGFPSSLEVPFEFLLNLKL